MKNKCFLFLLLLGACKAAPVSSTNTVYREDLSVYRAEKQEELATTDETEKPTIDSVVLEPSTLTEHIREELDSVNAIIVQRNREKLLWDGYVIQVYSGLSRDAAYEARSRVRQLDLGLNPKVEYYQPSYRVKCGAYFDQLKAHEMHEHLKKLFPQALLLPEKIRLIRNEPTD